MVPVQLSERVSLKTKELIVDFRKRQAALHFSYDQWDPCGEGE